MKTEPVTASPPLTTRLGKYNETKSYLKLQRLEIRNFSADDIQQNSFMEYFESTTKLLDKLSSIDAAILLV